MAEKRTHEEVDGQVEDVDDDNSKALTVTKKAKVDDNQIVVGSVTKDVSHDTSSGRHLHLWLLSAVATCNATSMHMVSNKHGAPCRASSVPAISKHQQCSFLDTLEKCFPYVSAKTGRTWHHLVLTKKYFYGTFMAIATTLQCYG